MTGARIAAVLALLLVVGGWALKQQVERNGELMDGRHRLMKAILLGHETIQAVRFDRNPDPDKITGDS